MINFYGNLQSVWKLTRDSSSSSLSSIFFSRISKIHSQYNSFISKTFVQVIASRVDQPVRARVTQHINTWIFMRSCVIPYKYPFSTFPIFIQLTGNHWLCFFSHKIWHTSLNCSRWRFVISQLVTLIFHQICRDFAENFPRLCWEFAERYSYFAEIYSGFCLVLLRFCWDFTDIFIHFPNSNIGTTCLSVY